MACLERKTTVVNIYLYIDIFLKCAKAMLRQNEQDVHIGNLLRRKKKFMFTLIRYIHMSLCRQYMMKEK